MIPEDIAIDGYRRALKMGRPAKNGGICVIYPTSGSFLSYQYPDETGNMGISSGFLYCACGRTMRSLQIVEPRGLAGLPVMDLS
jgi:hypothetical protein